jgi:hypothetical protein
MSEGAVRVKGSLIQGRLGYIQSSFIDRYAEYVAAFRPETRQAVETGLLPSSWYPFDIFLDVSGTAERLFGSGDYSVVRRMAAHSARVNMSTVYKIFLRLGSPEFLLKRTAQIWQVQYDSGVATSVPAAGGGSVEVRDFGRPDPLHCHGITGFMDECLRMTRAQGVSVAHVKCRCEEGDVCRWDATWNGA